MYFSIAFSSPVKEATWLRKGFTSRTMLIKFSSRVNKKKKTYCSNGSNCLFHNNSSFWISNLSTTWHFRHHHRHKSTNNGNTWNACKQNKTELPSFCKGNHKSTKKRWNKLYKLPNLSSINFMSVPFLFFLFESESHVENVNLYMKKMTLYCFLI